MCRTGGRRCPGCNGKTARAKHNARRRKNREIKRAVLEYLRREGEDASLIRAIEEQPPGVAKQLARERQLGTEALGVSLNLPGADEEHRVGPAAHGVRVEGVHGISPGGPAAVEGVHGMISPGGPAAVEGVHGMISPGGPAAVEGVHGISPGGPAAVEGVHGISPGPAPRRAAGPGDVPGRTEIQNAAHRLLLMLAQGDAVGPETRGAQSQTDDGDWMTPGLTRQVSTAMSEQGRTPVERLLLESEAEGVEYPDRGGVNETLRVDLGNGTYAYAKSFEGLDHRTARGYGHTSAQQPIHEVAAWRLAERMGEPWSKMVPPCVLRTVNGRLGSLAMERPGSPGHRGDGDDRRNAAFFDALVGNQDRHRGNYLVEDGRRRMTLIDHGFAFSVPGDYQNASEFQRQSAGARLTSRERKVLTDLLDDERAFGLKGLIEDNRLEALRDRARRMLAEDCIPRG